MAVRGAPLIGDTAAFGMALAVPKSRSSGSILRSVKKAARLLKSSRPTAVNLFHAVERMMEAAQRSLEETSSMSRARRLRALSKSLVREARLLCERDAFSNRKLAECGARLLPRSCRVMTYCNTGNLATYGYGTAAGIIYEAHRRKKLRRVYVCETRPYLQGSRLTLWEFLQEGLPAVLITDNMAAHVMKTERIDAVIVGADRIAANGDVANKIGTYGLALLARCHRIPFYVAAPTQTIDWKTPSGRQIPIEQRSASEVIRLAGRAIAPEGATALHPAFDVTPAKWITAIITEKGVHRPPFSVSLSQVKN